MDKMTSNEQAKRRHQQATAYTEDQARLLFAMRDMVREEVKRQLKELNKTDINH